MPHRRPLGVRQLRSCASKGFRAGVAPSSAPLPAPLYARGAMPSRAAELKLERRLHNGKESNSKGPKESEDMQTNTKKCPLPCNHDQ